MALIDQAAGTGCIVALRADQRLAEGKVVYTSCTCSCSVWAAAVSFVSFIVAWAAFPTAGGNPRPVYRIRRCPPPPVQATSSIKLGNDMVF